MASDCSLSADTTVGMGTVLGKRCIISKRGGGGAKHNFKEG